MFETLTNQLADRKIVPVIALEEADSAGDLADALTAGGLPVAEVTFRTAAAAAVIERMAQRPGLLVGAGTIRSVEQAEQARGAGATFLVTPGLNIAVVDWAIANDMPILPGIDSTLAIEMASARGLSVLKFFPAGVSGGLPKIKALAGPYPDIRYIPTGGIGPANLNEWLSHPAVLACGGSWLVEKSLLAGRNWQEVERLTADAVSIAAQGA